MEYIKATSVSASINYDGKVFVSVSNSDNGEVDDKTVFCYHQNGEIF